MNMPSLSFSLRCAVACLGIVSAALIGACGGAIGSGGTGAAPPAVSGGTVTGFGSVVIDGLAVDDRLLATVAEVEPGADSPAEARMGHRVEIEVDADGRAKLLRVEATVIGSVSSVALAGPSLGTFTVLGQTISVNGDPVMGPVTQFGGGYAGALDIGADHWVEVHGVSRPVVGGAVIQATRIDRLLKAPAYLRVSGLVSALGEGGAGRFTLGSLVVDSAAAAFLPAGATLANGAAVVVFALPAKLATPAGSSPVLSASAVRVKAFRSAGAETYASGFVASLDAANGQFKLNGQTVRFLPADVQPAGSQLADGQYVQASGSVDANGVLVATRVKLRDGRSEPEAELKGSVLNFSAASGTFFIRGVQVALVATTKLEGCPATGLRDGLFVELEGSLRPTGVTAKKVACKEEPTGAVIEREGTASGVDLLNSAFMLTASGKAPVKVRWTPLTYFGFVTPLTLNGKRIEVEGTLFNGEILAAKIKAEH